MANAMCCTGNLIMLAVAEAVAAAPAPGCIAADKAVGLLAPVLPRVRTAAALLANSDILDANAVLIVNFRRLMFVALVGCTSAVCCGMQQYCLQQRQRAPRLSWKMI